MLRAKEERDGMGWGESFAGIFVLLLPRVAIIFRMTTRNEENMLSKM